MSYREAWIDRNSHRIYARDYPGQEPAIVLLHGFPDNLHLYDRLVPHLNPPRRVVTFDFLGWGDSDKPANYPYTATNQTGDLDAVIGQLGLDDYRSSSGCSISGCDASVNSRNWPVTRNATCSPMSTALSPIRSI
jgi:alpha-beta hydrolase superfamily lysophospholipase